MKNRLSQLKLLQSSPHGHLYKGLLSQTVKPGQGLNYSGSTIDVLRCESTPSGHLCQLLTQEELPLATNLAIELGGTLFDWFPDQPSLMLCEGRGCYQQLFWLDHLRKSHKPSLLSARLHLCIMHQPDGFIFQPVPSRRLTPELPAEMIAALPLLEDLNLTSRLCCDRFIPGAFEGDLEVLAQRLADTTYAQIPWAGFMSAHCARAIEQHLGTPQALCLTGD